MGGENVINERILEITVERRSLWRTCNIRRNMLVGNLLTRLGKMTLVRERVMNENYNGRQRLRIETELPEAVC